jgi:hypothetical protein
MKQRLIQTILVGFFLLLWLIYLFVTLIEFPILIPYWIITGKNLLIINADFTDDLIKKIGNKVL